MKVGDSVFGSDMLFAIPGIIIAFTVCGYVQAKTATLLGDPTPRMEGRLTLNPIPHIDPWGLLMMLVLHFGWGRSAVTDPRYFKNPKKGLFMVTLAGLGTNLLIAFLTMLIAAIALKFMMIPNWLMAVIQLICWFNVMFFVLNMIPIPPLDGSRIVAYFLPHKLAYQYESYGRYGFLLLIALIYLFNFGAVLRPIIEGILSLMLLVVLVIC